MSEPLIEQQVCGAIIEWGDAHCELRDGHDGPHKNMTLGVSRDRSFDLKRLNWNGPKLGPSVPLSAIQALVQQWREQAFNRYRERDVDNVLNECADELAALCPAPPEDR